MEENKSFKQNRQNLVDTKNPITVDRVNDGSTTSVSMSRPTSLGTLVAWNISKALEKNPSMNIKEAIISTQRRMKNLSGVDEVQSLLSEHPCQRNLMCALLAWEELGRSDAEGLCRFIEDRLYKREHNSKPVVEKVEISSSSKEFKIKFAKPMQDSIVSSCSMGPVIKLPVETKVVMRLEKVQCSRDSQPGKTTPRAKEKDIMSKIDQACCLDSACTKRLEEFDGVIQELRNRAGLLAKREAERVELLERAENAWKELERGYQKRLSLAEEKEEDVARQLKKVIEERNTHKNECSALAKSLKDKAEKAEKERANLQKIEKDLCKLACTRLQLSEAAAKGDAMVAEQQCRAAQADRDFQFKEEQARRKVSKLESELESARALTYEAERALRAELAVLRNQIENVSKHLLEEDAEHEKICAELKLLNEEKMEMIEDLESCKVLCDGRMQAKNEDLKKKREQLRELKNKEMECRCKLPVDATVQVKRTPSLAALCKCSPEDKILESCSCTSLRGTLLSNLLADLFSGLQSEMGGTATQMPCQLLKCLEDKHNWDRASIVKNNLHDYFSRLLVGELDIAIATSIEKYHAKWVGRSCADAVKVPPKPGEDDTEGWQERVIEKRAQKLASQLAEQLFQTRAEELTKKAKEIVASGPPPCECKPSLTPAQSKVRSCNETALYPCLLKSKPPHSPRPAPPHSYWHQTLQDVTQIRTQIEELKKASIKKEDLKMMENKFTKIMQQAAGGCGGKQDSLVNGNSVNDSNNIKERNVNRVFNNSNKVMKCPNNSGPIEAKAVNRKRCIESAATSKKNEKKYVFTNGVERQLKAQKRNTPTYSVNMCLCSVDKDQNPDNLKADPNAWKKNLSKECIFQMSSSMKHTKPINASMFSNNSLMFNYSKRSKDSCPSNCVCFHKIPSNTSLDQLLDTLEKWKCELDPSYDKRSPHKTCCVLNKSKLGCILNKSRSLDKQILDSGNVTNMLDSSKDVPMTSVVTKDTNIKNIAKPTFRDEQCSCHSSGNIVEANKLRKDAKSIRMIEQFSNEISIKPTVNTTESEYMGDINLEKSAEDYCKYENKIKNKHSNLTENKSSLFKCIQSSKRSCEKSFENKHLQSISSMAKKEKYLDPNRIRVRKERQVKDSFLYNRNPDVPRMILNKSDSSDSASQIKFLGVTLTNASPHKTYEDSLKSHHFDICNDQYSNNICKKKDIDEEITTKRNNQKEALKHNFDARILLKNDTSNLFECNKLSKNQVLINIKAENYETDITDDDQTNILRNKKYFHARGDIESLQKNQSDLAKKELIKSRKLLQRVPSCEKLGQNKNLQNNTFSKQTASDKAIETQSFTKSKQYESCICCNNIKLDESNDLEENAFLLLEEYFKDKLEYFKQASPNSVYFPPEEENKLFTATLERIKKLISDSTNQITCNCSTDQKLTKGSWNRAYALLQEYLKIKIQKVQCSCNLAEDNRDSILPVVLEKICNLIESDFQRLKDVCGSGNKRASKYDDCKELPEKDVNKTQEIGNNACPSMADLVINTDNVKNITRDTTSQVSSELKMTKSCSPMGLQSKSLQAIIRKPVSVNSVNTNKNYRYIPNVNYSMKGKSSPASPVSKSPTRKKYHEAIDKQLPKRFKVIRTSSNSSAKNDIKPNIKITAGDCSLISNNMQKVSRMISSQPDEDLVPNDEQIKERKFCEIQQNADVALLGNTVNMFMNEASAEIDSNAPYIGYTVDCSCNNTLETCICSKSIATSNNDKINSIWRKSKPDETYYKKVSYILNNHNPRNSSNLNPHVSEVVDDFYLKGILKNKSIKKNLSLEGENGDDDIVLKKSTEAIPKSNTMTNTFEDTNSIDTACSKDEDSQDWCECCSTINQSSNLENERLKNSIYFPAPVTDSENFSKDEFIANSNPLCKFNILNKTCECDMVPICHVKMLVENIENKLVTAKCTCDSLIPQVCPEHSTKLMRK